jgi:Cu-Zn family superoxide dismutase
VFSCLQDLLTYRPQVLNDVPVAGCKITGTISGLTPGLHGFSIYSLGNVTDASAVLSAGQIFHPLGSSSARYDHVHACPSSFLLTFGRLVGSIGNINADQYGVATVDITDTIISLTGLHSIIGRACVVCYL